MRGRTCPSRPAGDLGMPRAHPPGCGGDQASRRRPGPFGCRRRSAPVTRAPVVASPIAAVRSFTERHSGGDRTWPTSAWNAGSRAAAPGVPPPPRQRSGQRGQAECAGRAPVPCASRRLSHSAARTRPCGIGEGRRRLRPGRPVQSTGTAPDQAHRPEPSCLQRRRRGQGWRGRHPGWVVGQAATAWRAEARRRGRRGRRVSTTAGCEAPLVCTMVGGMAQVESHRRTGRPAEDPRMRSAARALSTVWGWRP